MEQLCSHWTDIHESWCLSVFLFSFKRIQVSLKSDKIVSALQEDQCTFLIISHSVLLGIKNLSDKSCRENQNMHFMFYTCFFNHAVYEIMWKNIVELGRLQMTVWCMHIACWLPKATNPHLDYVILTAFAWQQWLHEHALVLCYIYSSCLAEICFLHRCR